MDLKKIDEEYRKSKSKLQGLDKAKQRVEELKKEITKLIRRIEDLDIAKMRADQDNDKIAAKQIEEDLKEPLAKLNTARSSLQKLQAMIQNAEKAVDERLSELTKDPELQEHLNNMIGKKFSRQILHKQKEKETLLSHNEQLETIKAAAEKDQYVMNTIKGIEGYTKKIEELQSQTPVNTSELNLAKGKLEARKKDLSTYFKGTISNEVIESFTSFDDISRRIKSNIRQAKGIDKQIANYETALERIGFMSPRTAPESDRSTGSSSTSTNQILGGAPIESEGPSVSNSGRSASQNSSWIDERDSNNLPDTQPKWYQFIKRFKNWINRRKSDQETFRNDDELTGATGRSEIKENSKFKDAMKYDIIKDYEAKLEQDLLKGAKAERKASERENSER